VKPSKWIVLLRLPLFVQGSLFVLLINTRKWLLYIWFIFQKREERDAERKKQKRFARTVGGGQRVLRIGPPCSEQQTVLLLFDGC